jgi:aspartyl-tRNA(Asn)/glutamyl-tRNA(Gln) amidotransferase subunit C
MPIRPGEVETIAHLARLAIDESLIPGFIHDLSDVRELIEQMKAVETSGIEPMANPLDAVQRLRPDAVTDSDQRELFQSIAPATENGLYLVPRVIE